MDRFLSPAVVLAAAPIILFLFARLLEKVFSFVSLDTILLLRKDNRPAINQIREDVLNAIWVYVTNSRRIQGVFQFSFIALLSLLISQYTCTGSIKLTTSLHLILLIVLLFFIFFTLIMLWRGHIEFAAVGSTNLYYYTALGFNILVIILDRLLYVYPTLCVNH
jgi:hypothetical protein